MKIRILDKSIPNKKGAAKRERKEDILSLGGYLSREVAVRLGMKYKEIYRKERTHSGISAMWKW